MTAGGSSDLEGQYTRYHELKREALERILGPMHDIVGHATIPFSVGGAVDLYYFPEATEGTAFVTMELIEPDGTGPCSSGGRTYELVAFSRETVAPQRSAGFADFEMRIGGTFTTVGRYSFDAILNPGETCEVPVSGQDAYRCLLLDEYSAPERPFVIAGREHMLLLCVEVLRQEMEYAQANGSEELLSLLKKQRVYPYSDLSRPSVV